MADAFQDLLALVTPERFLRNPSANGEGVRICVVDTGVDREILHARHPSMLPVEGVLFQPDRAEPLPYDGRHSTPHGTTVADIILTIAPRVQLFSADVFGPRGTCEVETVMQALRWAVDVCRCRIVNLSLGVPEARLPQVQRRYHFLRAIEEGYYKDAILFAAAHNDHPLERSYPSSFAPPLISVDKGDFKDPWDFAYRLHHNIEFSAHGRGYLGPFAQEPATSWAAPHLAGLTARLLSLKPDLKPFEVKTLLYWMSRGQVAKR